VIDDIEFARALHVLFVVHWIGGVAFVTLVVLPLARSKAEAKAGWALFEAIESRFAAQVRWSIPLAGLTGFWMTWRLGLWGLFPDPSFWWLGAMVFVWTLFMLIVFVVEPLAHERLSALAARDPAGVLRRLFRAHIVLLAAVAVTILGAVAGAHGGRFQRPESHEGFQINPGESKPVSLDFLGLAWVQLGLIWSEAHASIAPAQGRSRAVVLQLDHVQFLRDPLRRVRVLP
jgi:uncharacterized membrane protein